MNRPLHPNRIVFAINRPEQTRPRVRAGELVPCGCWCACTAQVVASYQKCERCSDGTHVEDDQCRRRSG